MDHGGVRSHAVSDTRKETRDQTSGDLVARRNDCFRRLTRQKGCFAARLRVLSRSFRWPPEMESIETIFLKRLIRRLLHYSIIAPEINFARRCHLFCLGFQEKIFVRLQQDNFFYIHLTDIFYAESLGDDNNFDSFVFL